MGFARELLLYGVLGSSLAAHDKEERNLTAFLSQTPV